MIPPITNVLKKPLIENSFYLHIWEEIIATCIDIDIKSTGTVVVLKFRTKKVGFNLAPEKVDLDFLRGMIGNEIAILRTEDCFLLRKITLTQQDSKKIESKNGFGI